MFPNALKYADKLDEIRKQKNIAVNYFNILTKVDKNNRRAHFKNSKTNEE